MTRTTASVLLAALLATGLAVAREAPPAETPQDSGIVEEEVVRLYELKVRATDRKGRPITDLTAEEIRVLEGGKARRLAYFEPLARRSTELLRTEDLEKLAPVYDQSGNETRPDPSAVLPPAPQRRIVLTFDPRNSKASIRDDWRDAALHWVENGMREGDRVAVVVLRTFPDWIAPLSGDRATIAETLRHLDLYTDVPNRNRRDEMTAFVDDMRNLCGDSSGGRRQDPGRPETAASDLGVRESACAYEVARGWVHDWSVQTDETAETLINLAGQLSAIPGEKSVILFSEGMISDPATIATYGMIGVFGATKINLVSMTSRLDLGTSRSMSRLHEIAVASDVTFFTLDSRHANEGSNFSTLEHNAPTSTGMNVANPWGEMYETTRSSLSTLAYATGGRPFYGQDGLEWKLRAAADSFFGVYALGFYRDTDDPLGKVKVKTDRRRVSLDYNPDPFKHHRPGAVGLELLVGRPEPALAGDDQVLPVALLTPLRSLPLRKGAGGYGCELGVFAQAVRPDGSVSDETFETFAVVVDEDRWENAEADNFRHVVRLAVPQGPHRVRVRLSDDRQAVVGDRSIDLTVLDRDVRAGLDGDAAQTSDSAATDGGAEKR